MAASALRPLVLVIDDDAHIASALAMVLDDWGYDCVAAADLDEAVGSLGDRITNVVAVVVDVTLPEQWQQHDADRLCARLGQDVPILLSSTTLPGTSHVLAKPYDPDALRGWLQQRIPGA